MTGELYRVVNVTSGLGHYPTQFESPVVNTKTENNAVKLCVDFPAAYIEYRKIIDIGFFTASAVYNIESYEMTYDDSIQRYVFYVDRQFSYGDKAYFQFRALHVSGQEVVDPMILFLRFFRSIKSVDFASIDAAPSGTQTEILEDFVQQHGNVNASTIHTGHVRIDNETIFITASGVISAHVEPVPPEPTTTILTFADQVYMPFMKIFKDDEDNITVINCCNYSNIITDKKDTNIKLFRYPSNWSYYAFDIIIPEQEFIMFDFDISEFSSSTQILSASLILPIKYATENEWSGTDGDITIPNFFRCYNLESEPPTRLVEHHRYASGVVISSGYNTWWRILPDDGTYYWPNSPTKEQASIAYMGTDYYTGVSNIQLIQINNEALEYYVSNLYGGTGGVEFYRITSPWDITTVTYDTKPDIESTPFKTETVNNNDLHGYIENDGSFPYGVWMEIVGSFQQLQIYTANVEERSQEWEYLEFIDAQAYIGTEYIESTEVGLGYSRGIVDVTDIVKGWVAGTTTHIALGLVLNEYGSDYFTELFNGEDYNLLNDVHMVIKTTTEAINDSVKSFDISLIGNNMYELTSADEENDTFYIYSYDDNKDAIINDGAVTTLRSFPMIASTLHNPEVVLFDGDEYIIENSDSLYVSKKINGVWTVVYTSTELETEKEQKTAIKDEDGIYIAFARYDMETREIVLKYLEYTNNEWNEEELYRIYDKYDLHLVDIKASMRLDKKEDEIVIAVPHFGYNKRIADIAILRRVDGVWSIEDVNLFQKDNSIYSNGGFLSLEIEDVKIVDNGIIVMYRYLPVFGFYNNGTIMDMRAVYIKNDGSFYSFGHIGHITSPQSYYGPDGHSNLIIKTNGEIYTIYQVPHSQGGGGSSYDMWGDLTIRYLGNINDL